MISPDIFRPMTESEVPHVMHHRHHIVYGMKVAPNAWSAVCKKCGLEIVFPMTVELKKGVFIVSSRASGFHDQIMELIGRANSHCHVEGYDGNFPYVYDLIMGMFYNGI